VHELEGHFREVVAIAFSPDGHLVLSGSHDGTLRLWDVASEQAVHVLEGHRSEVNACAFSPDGHLAVSGSADKTLRLWDVTSGQTLGMLQGHTDGVNACAFSPDGRTVLSASRDTTLRLWDVSSGQTLNVLEGHTDGVSACAFSPDGRFAVSFASAITAGITAMDRTLRLWEMVSGREIARFDAEAQLSCCAFSPRGWRVVAGDRGGGVHFLTVVGMRDEPKQAAPPQGLPASQPSPVPVAPETPTKADSKHPWWQFWWSHDP
jgi:hypothetical protein